MDVVELENKAIQIRESVVKMLLEAGSGHSAGPLGITDVLVSLYFEVLKNDPKRPLWEERDRFFLSAGHLCPALYATLSHRGYFPQSELMTLRDFKSRLQGHPEREKLAGIESTSGPLGSGLSQAAGYAISARMDGKSFRVYSLTSDGEHNEGNHWEAVMLAGKYNLSNLTNIVDRNGIQIDGYTEDVMPLEPLRDKYESFGWSVLEVDGHNYEEIIGALNHAKAIHVNPTVIIANTIAGKGIEFMENLPEWHGKPPDIGQTVEALKDLRSLKGRLRGF